MLHLSDHGAGQATQPLHQHGGQGKSWSSEKDPHTLDPIAEYLSGQYQEGLRESEGSFTVSSERALEKLSSHQLPRTSAWTLKMVQAGVVAGSQQITIRQSAKSCQFRFTSGEFGSLEELLKAWAEPDPVVTLPQKHLSVALRTVAFARRRPVLIAQNCPQDGMRSLFWDGGKFCGIQEGGTLAWGSPEGGEIDIHVAGSPLATDKTMKRVLGLNDVVASEYKELRSNAVCCPASITLDARVVNHFGMQDVSMERKPLLFSAQAADHQSPSILRLPEEICLAQPALRQGARLAWTLYNSTSTGQSRVCWVNAGVICQEEPLNIRASRFQVRLFLPADDLETDLTALHLRFPSVEDREARIARAVHQFCDELEQQNLVGQILRFEKAGKGGVWLATGACLLAGVVLAPFTAGASFFVGVAALALGGAKGSSGQAPTRVDYDAFVQNLRTVYRTPG